MARDKRSLTIQQALEWAFRKEFAQLTLPDRTPVEERGFGFGSEYVLLQRMKLGGVRIDTSFGKSYPHDDAEALAAALSNLPREKGGIQMALIIAECSKTGITPDWMPGAVPQIQPVAWGKKNHLGQMAKTEVIRRYTRTLTTTHPRNPKRTVSRLIKVEESWCPCLWHPTLQQIETARDNYKKWRGAMMYLRDWFATPEMLRTIEIKDGLPPAAPWKRKPQAGL